MNKNKRLNTLITLCEGALMVALAVILDIILKFATWPNGGSISACAIPIIFFSYRRGWKWGLFSGLVLSGMQMILGFWAPPVQTFFAYLGVIMLDYVLAFSILGVADLFAKPFSHKLLGYGIGAAVVSLLRFLCSFLSGALIWGEYAPEDMNVWLYTLLYNGGYMLPNTLISIFVILLLCVFLDPKTLREPKK